MITRVAYYIGELVLYYWGGDGLAQHGSVQYIVVQWKFRTTVYMKFCFLHEHNPDNNLITNHVWIMNPFDTLVSSNILSEC